MIDEPSKVALWGLGLVGIALTAGAAAFAGGVFAYNTVRRFLP